MSAMSETIGTACTPVLARLQGVASGYVRRSVAYHLNDISKDHPDVVVRWLRDHLPGAPKARQATPTTLPACESK